MKPTHSLNRQVFTPLVCLGLLGFLTYPARAVLHVTHKAAEEVAVRSMLWEIKLQPEPKKLRVLQLTPDEIDELLNQDLPITGVDENNTGGAI